MNGIPRLAKRSPGRLARLNVAVLAGAALMLSLAACAANRDALATTASVDLAPPSAPIPLPPPEPAPEGVHVLALGESADIGPSTTLRFVRLVSDSRCPADVQCIWAGEVRIALTLASPTGSNDFELSERDNKATVQSFDVELVAYGPCPVAKAGPARECASLKASAVATK